MEKFLHFKGVKLVCFYLAMVMSGLLLAPAAAQAAFVSAVPPAGDADMVDLAAVRAGLQKDLVADRLSALGLDARDISHRLDALSPDELEAVAAEAEHIQSGGDGVGTLVTLAVLVLLVVLILKLMDKEVVIK